jgi:hypothetical protein
MTTRRFQIASILVVLAFLAVSPTLPGFLRPDGAPSASPRCGTLAQPNLSWRTTPVSNGNYHPPPDEGIRVPVSRFKTLRLDPLLVGLEAILRQYNMWDDPAVQEQVRLARYGTARGRERALARLAAVIHEYEAGAVTAQDPHTPYATAEQIGNKGAGVHILDQAGNGAPLRASTHAYCLCWLVLGAQGGGKSSAIYYQLSQMDVPFVILDPKGTWEYRSRQLRATVIPPAYIQFDFEFDGNWLQPYLHAVVEGLALSTGLQFGLSVLYEALDIALAQLRRYTEQTGQPGALCVKDLQQALALCDTRNPRRAQYFEAARTALDLLVGRNDLFATRSGLPLSTLFGGRYILPCWHLNTVQCRFLAGFLLNHLYFRSLGQGECQTLKSLLCIDDSSRFISKPDTVFGAGSRTSVYLHLLSILRSSGRGCIFVDQNVESISEDVKGLCNNWLVVGGIHGANNQSQVAAAMGLSREQTTMLGKLQCHEAVCFCPTTYPRAVHGFIPQVPPPDRSVS